MSKYRPETPHTMATSRVERRQALRGLGALAVMVSGCSSNTGSPSGSGGSSTGGSSAFGGSSSSGGSMSSGGSTARGGAGGSTPGGDSEAGPGTGGAAGQTIDGSANPGDARTTDAIASADAQLEAGVADLVVPPWDAVPTCTAVSATDGAGQGPFFIHDKEKNDDVSLYRQDIRGRYNMSAAPGVEMQLHLRILSKASLNCGMPIVVPNVDVYIWHTDAQGFYSSFGTRGGADEQQPDDPYMGVPSTTNLDTSERFCRGVQTTNGDGVVSYRSIFPGWYNGRVLHIHFVAFKPGSTALGRIMYGKQNEPDWLFTTQFYFDKAFAESVHSQYDPYRARTSLSGYDRAMSSGKMGTEPGSSGLIAKASLTRDIVTAQMQIVLDPS